MSELVQPVARGRTHSATVQEGKPAGLRQRALAAWQALDRVQVLALVLTSLAWAPLLAPGFFFNAHDAHHSVFYLIGFDEALRDGAWWPRWGPDHALGFGYPLWQYYSPLAYYVAEAFHLLGAGYTEAVKLAFIAGFIVSAWAMYQLVRSWWGRSAALVASVVYVYAPYHLVDVYVRNAFAEFMAFIFFPLVLLAFDRLIERGERRWLAFAGIAWAGVILTHTVTGLIFTPLLVAALLFMLVRHGRHEPQHAVPCTVNALAAGLLGVGLSAIFVVPLLAERSYIVDSDWLRSTYDYHLHFTYPHQLFSDFWGFGYSVPGPNDGMPLQIGLWSVVLGIAAVILAISQVHGSRFTVHGSLDHDTSQLETPKRSYILFFGAASLALALGMLPISQVLWDHWPMASLIQFPWRLMAALVFTLSILAGAVVAIGSGSDSERVSPGAWLLALAVALGSAAYTVPQFTPITPADESPVAVMQFETAHPDMIGTTAWVSGQLSLSDSPLLPQYLAGEPLTKAGILSGSGQVTPGRHGGVSEAVRVDASTPVTVQFYTYYFPGWQAWIDNTPVPVRPSGRLGLLELDVPAGRHDVRIRFGSTPPRTAGTVISLLSVVVVGILLLSRRTENRRQ